jgi:hypothetical protein
MWERRPIVRALVNSVSESDHRTTSRLRAHRAFVKEKADYFHKIA